MIINSEKIITSEELCRSMQIENIVSSGSFNQELNLKELSKIDCIEYGKNKYPGAYIKFNGHSVTIYHTGKYIIPGMRSFEELEETFTEIKNILSPYLDVSLFSEPEIRNLVCSSEVGHPLNLALVLIELINKDIDSSYEPESFPGLIVKTEDCTYNVFASGKFLILGCKSTERVMEAEMWFLGLLKEIGA